MTRRLPLILNLLGGLAAALLTAFVMTVGLLQLESRSLAERHATVAGSMIAVIGDVNELLDAAAKMPAQPCKSESLMSELSRHPYAAALFLTGDQGRLLCYAGDLPKSTGRRSTGARVDTGDTTFIISDGSETDAHRTLLVSRHQHAHVLVAAPVLPLLLSAVDAVWLDGADGRLLHARQTLDDRQVRALAAAARRNLPADYLDLSGRVYVRSDRVAQTPFALQSVLPLDEWLAGTLQSILAVSALVGLLTGLLIWMAGRR